MGPNCVFHLIHFQRCHQGPRIWSPMKDGGSIQVSRSTHLPSQPPRRLRQEDGDFVASPGLSQNKMKRQGWSSAATCDGQGLGFRAGAEGRRVLCEAAGFGGEPGARHSAASGLQTHPGPLTIRSAVLQSSTPVVCPVLWVSLSPVP